MTYGEEIRAFKAMSSPVIALPLVGNYALINAISAWKYVKCSISSGLSIDNGKSEHERWEWLWSGVSFDMEDFRIKAGLKVQEAPLVFKRLSGCRMIYPDSSIDMYCQQYLNSVILKSLQAGGGKKKSKSEEES